MCKGLYIIFVLLWVYSYGCSPNDEKNASTVAKQEQSKLTKKVSLLNDTILLKYLKLFPDTNRSFSDYKALGNYMISLKQKFLESKTDNNNQLQFDDSDTSVFIKNEFDKTMSILIFKQAQKWNDNAAGMSLLAMHSGNSAVPLGVRLALFEQFPQKIKESEIGKKTLSQLLKYQNEKNIGFDCTFFREVEIINPGSHYVKFGSLLNHSNKYTILIFGASWCHPCLIQERRFKKLYNSIDTLVIKVAAIMIDVNQAKFENYVKAEQYPWQCFRINGEAENSIFKKLGFTGVPRNFLLDSTGKILKEDLSVFALLKFIGVNVPSI